MNDGTRSHVSSTWSITDLRRSNTEVVRMIEKFKKDVGLASIVYMMVSLVGIIIILILEIYHNFYEAFIFVSVLYFLSIILYTLISIIECAVKVIINRRKRRNE